VKPDEVVKKTESGIVLAGDEKLKKTGMQRGVIVSVGPTAWEAYRTLNHDGQEKNGKAWAKVGDYVIFSRHAGRFIYDPFEDEEDDKNEYLIMNDEDILVVIQEGENPIPASDVQKAAKKMIL